MVLVLDLADGDHIGIGDYELRYVATASPTDQTSTAGQDDYVPPSSLEEVNEGDVEDAEVISADDLEEVGGDEGGGGTAR